MTAATFPRIKELPASVVRLEKLEPAAMAGALALSFLPALAIFRTICTRPVRVVAKVAGAAAAETEARPAMLAAHLSLSRLIKAKSALSAQHSSPHPAARALRAVLVQKGRQDNPAESPVRRIISAPNACRARKANALKSIRPTPAQPNQAEMAAKAVMVRRVALAVVDLQFPSLLAATFQR